MLRILSYTLHTFQGNKDLSDVTHVIVDEVHEHTILVCTCSCMFFSLCAMKCIVSPYMIDEAHG